MPVFKDNINPIVRSKLWSEFIELSNEARRLKDILDEQSIFATEQLEIAIKALDRDVKKYDQLLSEMKDIHFPKKDEFLKAKFESYNELQKELNLLNTFAAKINSLRKEIIKTDMRLRYKSKFFKMLSTIGDMVFPKRKELIKEVSNKFVDDVDNFCTIYFGEKPKKAPFFVLRDEIKALQNIAKILTLNTKAFTDTRINLSKCWDKIKLLESHKREESDNKRRSLKENTDKVSKKIVELKEKCDKAEITLDEAEKISKDIFRFMKTIELHRFDVNDLKKALKEAIAPLVEIEEKQRAKREEEKKQKQKQKLKQIEDLKEEIASLIADENNDDLETFSKKRDSISEKVKSLSLNKLEKQMFDRLVKPIKDLIADKKEKALLDLSDDQIQALDQLKQVLKQRIERRKEIKKQLETYRKASGGSGFDFEKALAYKEMIDVEKNRLEKIDTAIEEIEEKIADLEG